MPLYPASDIKGKILDVQYYISQCATLAHNLLYYAEPKPGAASFNNEFGDTKTPAFLAAAGSLYSTIFELTKRGILVAQNHLWFDDAELGYFILKGLDASKKWYNGTGNAILGTIIMFAPLSLSVGNYYATEGMKTSTPLNFKIITEIHEQFLKYSTTEDCILLTRAINNHISNDILPSDKPEDNFESFLEIHKHEKINLYDYTKFYEQRDLVFYELSHKYVTTMNNGYRYLTDILEKEYDFQKAISYTFIKLLSDKKDTHIAKRFGNEVATDIYSRAKEIDRAGNIFTQEGQYLIGELDYYMRNTKTRIINAASVADITATAIFLALLDGKRPK